MQCSLSVRLSCLEDWGNLGPLWPFPLSMPLPGSLVGYTSAATQCCTVHSQWVTFARMHETAHRSFYIVSRPVQIDVAELNWTEPTWFICCWTDQWASSSALQWPPSNGVGGLCYYAHVCVNQWPLGSLCLPISQFVNN